MHFRVGIVVLLFVFGVTAYGVASHSMLTQDEMWADLNHVADLITRVHPDPFHSGTEIEFQQLLAELKQTTIEPMERDKFFYVINQLAVFVRDGHTFVRLTDEAWHLPARFEWVSDGIVVVSAHDESGLYFGDQILEIGGKTPDNLLEALAPIVIAENTHALKAYGGQRLASGSILQYLGLVRDNKVDIYVKDIAGEQRLVEVNLTRQPLSPTETRSWFGWHIDGDNSLGYFYLDQCANTSEYRDVLKEFFQAVKDQHVQVIAMDVRRNSGGDSRVIDEFISYLPVRRVRSHFGEIRYSPEAQEQRGYSRDKGYRRINRIYQFLGLYTLNIPKLSDATLGFSGDVYILTSPITFSSANWFAVIFQDNELGEVLGEPTGNAPTSYGDILRFTVPHSQFPMIISHKSWIRPDRSRDPSDALYPDIHVPTTVRDVQGYQDPQLEKLREIMQGKYQR